MSAVIGIYQRKARKQHPCAWCREPIQIGEVYTDAVCVDDGSVFSWRLHPDCEKAEERAADYTRPMDGEGVCCNVDVDGGSHQRGQNCPECSDMTL